MTIEMNEMLVILGSARKDGNTKHIVDVIFKDKPHLQLNLLDFYIYPYNYQDEYPSNDKLEEVVKEILVHQTIVFATPVYWYAMSGIMKNFFDRLTELVTTKKDLGRALKGKSVSLIAVGTDPELPDGFEIPFKLTATYFEMEYKHRIYFTEEEKNPNQEKLTEINDFLNRLH